ncbi:MAG: UPF0280 family protein [Bacteroidales bacterium]
MMMEYQERTYRRKADHLRFSYFRSVLEETDLWIGVDHASRNSRMEGFVEQVLKDIRKDLVGYALSHPGFFHAHNSLPAGPGAPEVVRHMCSASAKAGVGPMAAVAGTFSAMVGERLKKEFSVRELIVENGGDIWLQIESPLTVSVEAGNSPLSGKAGLEADPEYAPLGICTSSGTFGHSFSYGRADAVMIACRNCSLADALATAWCNRILREKDVARTAQMAGKVPEILSVIAIRGEKLGVAGKLRFGIFA